MADVTAYVSQPGEVSCVEMQSECGAEHTRNGKRAPSLLTAQGDWVTGWLEIWKR